MVSVNGISILGRRRRNSHCRLTAAYKLSSSLDPTRHSVCPGHTLFLHYVETGDIFIQFFFFFIHFKFTIMCKNSYGFLTNIRTNDILRRDHVNTRLLEVLYGRLLRACGAVALAEPISAL